MPHHASIRPDRRTMVWLFCLATVTGCANSTSSSQPTGSAAATSKLPSATAPSVAPTTGAVSVPVTVSATTTANVLGVTVNGDKLMPSVVCLNLQDAQDLIQTHGVFYSRSVDATGKGRHQIVDRNWVVVDQTPPAGTPIGEGDAVLSVVKLDEPNPC